MNDELLKSIAERLANNERQLHVMDLKLTQATTALAYLQKEMDSWKEAELNRTEKLKQNIYYFTLSGIIMLFMITVANYPKSAAILTKVLP